MSDDDPSWGYSMSNTPTTDYWRFAARKWLTVLFLLLSCVVVGLITVEVLG